MIKIVVPTDFSETSKNAAMFAIRMAEDIPGSKLLLYNSFDKVVAGSDGTPLSSDNDTRKYISVMALENLKSQLNGNSWVDISVMAEEGAFMSNLESLVKREHIDMVVMGINGATRMEQVMIGSTTLGTINQSFAPVMIIPPDARYKKIRTVIYASDMKDVETTTPADQLRKVLGIFNPKLFVANVNVEHYVEPTEEIKVERAKLDKILEGYVPDYAFIRLFDFTEAINQFAEDRHADLIITAPRRHSFLSKLFSTSHTRKLAYHSHIPVLAIHQ
jgi:nucleotide-binding universal stress UspA family protein